MIVNSPKFTFLERKANNIDSPKLTIKLKAPMRKIVTNEITKV